MLFLLPQSVTIRLDYLAKGQIDSLSMIDKDRSKSFVTRYIISFC